MIVITIGIVSILVGVAVMGSAPQTARSAYLPGSMEPLVFSSNAA